MHEHHWTPKFKEPLLIFLGFPLEHGLTDLSHPTCSNYFFCGAGEVLAQSKQHNYLIMSVEHYGKVSTDANTLTMQTTFYKSAECAMTLPALEKCIKQSGIEPVKYHCN